MVALKESGRSRLVGWYPFGYIGLIEVARADDGSIYTHRPQARYAKARQTRLHRYGNGAFCKVVVSGLPASEGVYTVFVGEDLAYIGETVNLCKRWYDYGQISPRKCYVGGQETNCRVNKLILETARRDIPITLWLHETTMRAEIEGELRHRFRPPWNMA